MLDFIIFIFLAFCSVITLFVTYFIGSFIEKKHYQSIKNREKIYITLPTTNLKNFDEDNIEESKLVCGSAVISIDKFKRFLAKLINIFGGRVISYESIMDRARREAILRMKQQAVNYDLIINTRIENSTIGKTYRSNDRSGMGCVEVFVYGTAIRYKQNELQTR